MSRWDEDVEARLVGPLKNYHAGAVHAVLALPIIRGDDVDGYLYIGVDDEAQKAGVQGKMSGDFEPGGSRYWSARLRAFFEQGIPASAAFEALRGAQGDHGRGRIGTELQRFASRRELIESLDPRPAPSAEHRRNERRSPSRSEIDQTLRGDARETAAVESTIRDMDAALTKQPTPEPLVVSMGRRRASLPVDLSPGTVVREPTYLVTVLTDDASTVVGGEVHVVLRVPEGVPALLQPSALPSHPPRLLIARGLSWRVLRVVESESGLLVTGEIVASSGG